MKVRFVGTGDAFGSGGRWQTCLHLSHDGQQMLVNCGATSLAAMKSQGLDPRQIGAVAITHLHGDHFGGLPFLILDGQFSRRTRPLLVAGPPGIGDRLAQAMEVLFPGSSQVTRRFDVEVSELAVDGTPARLGVAGVYHLDYVTLRRQVEAIAARRVVLTHMSHSMLARLADADLPAAHDAMTIDL